MKKLERVHFIDKTLARLYPNPKAPLRHYSHFTLLLAVLLSARCTDQRVNQVTPALFNLADTPERFMERSVEEVQQIIRPCGLSPQKAKNILALSKLLVEEFSGEVPASLDALTGLPGVGRKTAQVVLAQAFGIPSFPVDTHILRLTNRWRISTSKNPLQVEKDCKKLFPSNRWNQLHLQIIFYGREYCTAYSCQGTSCFICSNVNLKRRAS